MADKIDFLITAQNQTKSAFDEIESSLGGITGKLGAFAGVAGAVVAAAGALAAKYGDMADELDNASLLLGVSTQTLREWQAVGELANVSSDQMVTNLEKLSRAAGEAVGGNKELAAAFERIGITQEELAGDLADLDTLFPAVVEGLRGLGDGYEQVSTAQEIFSRGGIAMLGVVRESPEALAAATEAFRKFAGVVTDDEVQALADLKDRYDALLFAIEQRGLSLMAQGATVLLQFVDAMNQADQVRAEERVRALTEELGKLDAQLQQQLANPPRSQLGQWALDVLGLFPGGPIDTDAIRERMAEIRAEVARLTAENDLGGKPGGDGGGKPPVTAFPVLESIDEEIERERILNMELALLDQSRTDDARRLSEERQAMWQAEADQRALILASMTEAERIENERAAALQAQKDRQERLAKAQHYIGLLAGMTSYNKTFFQIAKVAAIANAVISTHQGAAQALKDLPFPANIAAAAAVVAAGVAQIAAIQQTQFGQTAASVQGSGPGGFPTGPAALPPPATAVAPGQQQQSSVEIVVRGGDSAGQALLDLLSVEINQRDQVFIKNGSRQAAELVG